MFDLICETTLNEDKHRHENMITMTLESLCKTMSRTNKNDAIEFWHHCFCKVVQCNADSSTLRHRIVRSVCIPLLAKLPADSVTKIFTMNRNSTIVISKLLGDLKEQLPLDEDEIIAYDKKISTFELLAALYQSIPANSINQKVSPVAMGMGTKGNALTVSLCQCARKAVLTAGRGSELHHQYVCAAFNCLASVVGETQTNIRFFEKLIFRETPEKNELVWENIAMPSTFTYKFQVETNFRRIRWDLARQGSRTGQRDDETKSSDTDLRTLSTQYLADSSFMSQSTSDEEEQQKG